MKHLVNAKIIGHLRGLKANHIDKYLRYKKQENRDTSTIHTSKRHKAEKRRIKWKIKY